MQNAIFFNMNDGYAEAILRGYSLGFISEQEYLHLKQCETIDDIKLNLTSTDYGQFLNDESQLTPAIIRTKALDKIVKEFNYLRSQVTGPLAKFLDYITYDYQIDSIMLILKATLNNPNVQVVDLIEQTHPLGRFSESILKSICSFENSPKGYAELYQTVLIDIPVGKYMSLFLKEEGDKTMSGTNEVKNLLEEMPITKLENSLRKYYLEDFYNFCTKEIGGETGIIMGELLKSKADQLAINITLNSFGTTLNDPNMRKDRQDLYPSLGNLYPIGFERLSFVSDEDELGEALRPFKQFSYLYNQYRNDEKTIDDLFFEKEVMENEIAFEGQFNYACFYSYIKLREAEIRNLLWICECIVQKSKSRLEDHFIPVFAKVSPWRAASQQT